MKCQRKRVAVARVLRLEVLGAVLAHDLDPRLGERTHLLDRDVLRRDDDRRRPARPRPGSARRLARTSSGDTRDHSLDAARLARRAGARRSAPDCTRCRGRRGATSSTPASRSARSAALQRSSVVRDTSARSARRTARPPRARPRSSRARSPGPIAAADARRRARRRRSATTPPSRPRQPTWSDGHRRRAAVARASAIGRQSALIARMGRSGSSVQRPSPGSPRAPGSRAVHDASSAPGS